LVVLGPVILFIILICFIEGSNQFVANAHGSGVLSKGPRSIPLRSIQGRALSFQSGVLNMQERGNKERAPDTIPFGDIVKVPTEYWEDLKRRDLDILCENTLARTCPPDGVFLPFLGEDLLVDWEHRCLRRFNHGLWESVESPLLELLCLEGVSKPQIAFEGKAKADEKAQHTW
jgi:hypothetical protein